ncbi:MAG: GerMN domain-containing protein [Patescibacteria group bacterium]
MKEKINITKAIILSFIIILIVVVGYIAVVRYEMRIRIERETNEKISKSKNTPSDDLIGGVGDTMQVFVFFQNKKLANDPDFINCDRVFPVARTIERVPGVAHQALQELLLGPTEGERGAGYTSAISQEIGLHINSVILDQGILTITFNRPPFMGGSCALAGVVSQIKTTAKQFPSVKEVTILVDGNEEWANP